MKTVFFSKKHDPNKWDDPDCAAFGPIDIKLPDGEIVTIGEFLRRGYQIRWGNAIILGEGTKL